MTMKTLWGSKNVLGFEYVEHSPTEFGFTSKTAYIYLRQWRPPHTNYWYASVSTGSLDIARVGVSILEDYTPPTSPEKAILEIINTPYLATTVGVLLGIEDLQQILSYAQDPIPCDEIS